VLPSESEEIGADKTAKPRFHARPLGLVSFSDDLTDDSLHVVRALQRGQLSIRGNRFCSLIYSPIFPEMTIARANVDIELVQTPLC